MPSGGPHEACVFLQPPAPLRSAPSAAMIARNPINSARGAPFNLGICVDQAMYDTERIETKEPPQNNLDNSRLRLLVSWTDRVVPFAVKSMGLNIQRTHLIVRYFDFQ